MKKRNRLNSRKIISLNDLSKHFGISYSTLNRRLREINPASDWLYDPLVFLFFYDELKKNLE